MASSTLPLQQTPLAPAAGAGVLGPNVLDLLQTVPPTPVPDPSLQEFAPSPVVPAHSASSLPPRKRGRPPKAKPAAGAIENVDPAVADTETQEEVSRRIVDFNTTRWLQCNSMTRLLTVHTVQCEIALMLWL